MNGKKNYAIGLAIVCVCLAAGLLSCAKKTETAAKPETGKSAAGPEVVAGTIAISGAFALYPLVVRWGEEYNKIQPKVQLEISAGGAGKGMADTLGNMVDLGMVSREIFPVEVEKGAVGFAVAKDAVVGVINRGNPALEAILKQGIPVEKVKALWIDGVPDTWGKFTGTVVPDTINLYTRSDACGAAAVWGEYMGKYNQEDLKGTGIFGDPGIIEAVRADRLGIGYGNVNFIYDAETLKPLDGVVVLPLDTSGDGVLDAAESFYGNRNELTAAIVDGRYPSPPARALFLVTKGKPSNPTVLHFLKWVLTEGQRYVEESGYIKLPDEIVKKQLAELGT